VAEGVGEGEGEKEGLGRRPRVVEFDVGIGPNEAGRGFIGLNIGLDCLSLWRGKSGCLEVCSERCGTAALSGFCPVVGLVDRDENGLLIPGTASLKVNGNDVRMFIVTRSKASLYSIN
jgi:hypothetical protein